MHLRISTVFRLWLLACIGCAVTFAYGFYRPHGLHYSNGRFTAEIVSERGRLWLAYQRRGTDPWIPAFVQRHNP